jgi:hypothetical protein
MIPGPEILASLAARFSTKPIAENEVHAVVDGIPVEVRFTLREHGSSSSKWTEIAVKPEHLKGFKFTFNFDVRPAQSGDANDVRDGRLRDVVVGDEAFDAAFIVEAAPEDVLRLAFDETSRAEMLALRPIRVVSTGTYAVLIERLDWLEDVDVLERMTRLAARIAAALTPAARDAAEARRRTPKGGYRDRAPTDDEIRSEWDADVAALNAQSEQRRIRSGRIALAFGLGIFALVTFVTILLAAKC